MNGGGGGASNTDAVSGRNIGGPPSSIYANGNTNTQSGGYNENSSNLGTRETGIIEKLLVSTLYSIFSLLI